MDRQNPLEAAHKAQPLPGTTRVPVTLASNQGKSTGGEVTLVEWDRPARLKRALKSFALCWGLAIVSIPIPPVHWVLVPGFLIAGPLVFSFVLQQERMILGGQGLCPNCGKPFQIAKTKVQWPLNDVCGECHDAVTITPIQTGPGSQPTSQP